MRYSWKRSVNPLRLRKSDLTGTAKVFKFTLRQFLKSKASIAMIIVMFLSSGGSLLISSFSANAGVLKESETDTLYIVNGTGYAVGAEELIEANGVFAGIKVVTSRETIDSVRGRLDGEAAGAAAEIRLDEKAGAYVITLYSGKGSRISALEMSALSSALVSAFSEARLKGLDATEEQLKTVMSPYSVKLVGLDEYTDAEPRLSTGTLFSVNFIYTILLFILIMYSAIYIIRSIVDEKTTSLVEILMVSIRPLALIVGKILASMCLMLINFAMLAVGLGLSYLVLEALPDSVVQVGNVFASLDLSSALKNLNWFTVLAIFISMLLGYLSYSIIGGLSGACCSSIEDAESANTAVVLLCFFGYFGSIATAALSGKAGSAVVSLIPFLSAFTAPVRYATGQISLAVLLLSWQMHAADALLLFGITAKVYEALLLNKGNRIRLRQLLLMAKTEKGGERA